MPRSESTATSVVPPPMSTTIDPIGSVTGIPAPIAAAIGSSIRYTWLAPAVDAASRIARRSTEVEPDGTQSTISGQRGKRGGPRTFLIGRGSGGVRVCQYVYISGGAVPLKKK